MRVTSSSALFPSFSDQVYVLYLKFKNLYDEVLGAAQLRGLEELPWDILYIMPKSPDPGIVYFLTIFLTHY